MFKTFGRFFNFFNNKELLNVKFNITGIGNIGKEYEGTRHNIGFEAVRSFSENFGGEEWWKSCRSKMSVTSVNSEMLSVSVLPQTYVNRSGEAVSAVNCKYEISAKNTLVVTDDFNIPLGTMRFRKKGSAGGHNGLKSVIEAIGSDFPRLRLGVGPLPEKTSVIDFVLGKFDDHEIELKGKILELASEAVQYFCEYGIDAAMNKYNGRDVR